MRQLPTWVENADRVLGVIRYLETRGFRFGDVDPDNAVYFKGTFTDRMTKAEVWVHKPPTPSQFKRPGGEAESGNAHTALSKAKEWVDGE